MTLWAGLYEFHLYHPLSFIHIYWELTLCQKLWIEVNLCLSLAAFTSNLLSSTLKSALNKVPVWAINPELTLLILDSCSVHVYNFASLFCSSTCLWNLWFADSFWSYLYFWTLPVTFSFPEALRKTFLLLPLVLRDPTGLAHVWPLWPGGVEFRLKFHLECKVFGNSEGEVAILCSLHPGSEAETWAQVYCFLPCNLQRPSHSIDANAHTLSSSIWKQ